MADQEFSKQMIHKDRERILESQKHLEQQHAELQAELRELHFENHDLHNQLKDLEEQVRTHGKAVGVVWGGWAASHAAQNTGPIQTSSNSLVKIWCDSECTQYTKFRQLPELYFWAFPTSCWGFCVESE